MTLRLPDGSHVEARSSCAQLRVVGRLAGVTVENAHDAIKIDEATSARFAAHAADVAIGRLTGPAQINTQQGNIHIAEAASSTVVLRTRMGNVAIGAAVGVSASLDPGTGHGRIDNTPRNTDGAAAGPSIHAIADRGGITARGL